MTKDDAEKSYIPSWWEQAIAIEYLPCRNFTKGERIAEFDFSSLTEEQIENAVAMHKIVSYGTIIHNVDLATFKYRVLVGLFNSVSKPLIQSDATTVMPHGVVSKHHFPWLMNPINVCDPFESFHSHIQVLDNGVLYQWEVAKFEGVENRNYGRWVSNYVDLTEFDELHDDFQKLMQLKYQSSQKGTLIEEYVPEAEKYIDNIRSIRFKVFSELWNVHNKFKSEKCSNSKNKMPIYKPPQLSHFETMDIKDGDIFTITSMAPIFYRAALKHCHKAKELNESINITVHILDEIYEERAESIIMAAACLEAVINEIGNLKHPDIWKELEKLSLGEKYKIVFHFSNNPSAYDTSKSPFQFMPKIISARNEMIHFKQELKKVTVVKNDQSVSKLAMTLSEELVNNLPKILSDAITKIYESTDLLIPKWLENQVDWKVIKNA